MRFGARVTSADYDERSARWTVTDDSDTVVRAHYFVAATGVLSIPYFPDVPGREDFEGESYHTGLWPDEPVDFTGKRVAVVGTGSSGVQIIPRHRRDGGLGDGVQRSPNWCTPLNNAPITADEQARLRRTSSDPRRHSSTSRAGSCTWPDDRATFDDSEEEREAFFERMWRSPGFSKLTGNYTDVMFDGERQRSVVRVHGRQDPGHRRGPGDRGQADPQGSPVRREAPALRHRLLRDLQLVQRRAGRSAGDTRSCG